MPRTLNSTMPDLVQAYAIVSLLGFSLGLSYVFLSAKMHSLPLPYYNLGLLFFFFLLFFIFGRIPVGLIAASTYRNFLGPTSMLLLSLSIYLFRAGSQLPYLIYASISMGLATTAGSIAATSKLSEDFSSQKVARRKRSALALGSICFPLSISVTAIIPLGYVGMLFYIMLAALAVGAVFLVVSFYRYFVEHIRPTQETLYAIVSRTIAPLRTISKIEGKDYFLTALSVDTLFTFSAWAIVIYLPYYDVLVTNSIESVSMTFALISGLYILMRFLGQRIRADSFFFFSYFIRPILFILAFFMLSFSPASDEFFYSLLMLAAVGLFEDGAKQFVLNRFEEDDRQIVQRSMEVIKTPFTIFAPAFSFVFFSISFSLGFASAIIPAAISLMIMMFAIGNPTRESTTIDQK